MSGAVELLRARGVLADLDWHFARTVGRVGGERRPAVLLAAALASRAVGQGHVCLDLPRIVNGGFLVDDAGLAVDCPWPALDQWTAQLRASPLVDAPPGDRAATPLVIDAADRIYLRRYWDHQTRLAAAIRLRTSAPQPEVDAAQLRDSLDRLFRPESGGAPPDEQRHAALVAALRRFCVITGGPGTGKTYTVLRILAVLIEQALAAGRGLPRIVLLAPTGKAAARLSESIAARVDHLPCSAAVRGAIPTAAATIHRGLGAAFGRLHFRHGPDNPLLADVVLVDESSMIDLALLARLVDATPPSARLILLGDQDQLASVEAGAVLGDICNRGAPRAYSRPFVDRVAATFHTQLPHTPAAPQQEGIWDCIVPLTRSYRYRADSGIGRLASAINAGDVDAALAALESGDGVARVDPAPTGRLGAAAEAAIREGFAPYLACREPLARLAALGRFRVLCAHRRGPSGVETVNAQIEALLSAGSPLRPAGTEYAGRPILITQNDYRLHVFNGDIGVIAEDGQQPGRLVALFQTADGAPRRIATARLPAHQTVFATSIHKSQGSEFDAVVIVLPELPSPLISRELLYTAVTRARSSVLICAPPALVAHAVTHRLERASGLRDALWAQ